MSYAKIGRFIQLRSALAMALVLVALFSAATVQPVAAVTTFNVDSFADAPDDNIGDGACATAAGECTLRAAIQEANVTAGIVFIMVSQPGTYTLTDQLAITGQDILIYGASAADSSQVIIDGDNVTRVFDIGVGASVSIFWVTLQGGQNVNSEVVNGHWHGGAIHNHGDLTMQHVVIKDSAATDLPPGDPDPLCLWVCGGALYNAPAADAHLLNVTLVDNTAALHGGAISNGGTLTLENLTLTSNTATGNGGAIHNTSIADVTHVTVANNSATTGGGLMNDGGTLTLAASILASNTGGNCAGSVTSDGYNLSDDATCNLTGTGDLDNNPNANLGPLADNGGPTETHALLPGSEAINHMPPPCLVASDQRGVSRPQGAGCDIGAFEVEFTQTYYQACLYAGSLSRVGFIGESTTTTVNCGRGTPVVLLAGGDPGVDVYHACLYAGSLSQVGTTEPTNCGRGTPISLVEGTDLWACLYAGSLSQVAFSEPANCGRGVKIGLMTAP